MSAQAKTLKKFASKGYRDTYVSSRIRSSIALQTRDNRKKQKLTQQQLAKAMGKSQSDVSSLENPDGDHVTVQSLLDAAAALNVALVIRFASYPEFLRLMSDMSPGGLAVETIDETKARSIPSSFDTGVYIRVPTGGFKIVQIGGPKTWPQNYPMSPLPSGRETQYVHALPSIGTSMPTSAKDNWAPSTSP